MTEKQGTEFRLQLFTKYAFDKIISKKDSFFANILSFLPKEKAEKIYNTAGFEKYNIGV
jgi:hypothetical protein